MKHFAFGLIIASLLSFSKGAEQKGFSIEKTLEIPVGLPKFSAPSTSEALLIAVGEILFGSPRLSGAGTVSCATCHKAENRLADTQRFSVGHQGKITKRNTPSIFNTTFYASLMFDGRATSLEVQVRLPLLCPDEMGFDWTTVSQRLRDDLALQGALKSAGISSFDQSTLERSLATYVRSLLCGGSRFDRYYYLGEREALSIREVQGMKLFLGRGRCSICHRVDSEFALFSDNAFHVLGVGLTNSSFVDVGRFAVTKDANDKGAFKTPTLRNVGQTGPYMHDGSFTTLKKVVEFYDRGGNQAATNLDKRIRPLELTPEDRDDLVAFLLSLDAPIVSFRPKQN